MGTKQVEVGASVNVALHELELGDLTFDLPVRPWFAESCMDGIAVSYNTIGEGPSRPIFDGYSYPIARNQTWPR